MTKQGWSGRLENWQGGGGHVEGEGGVLLPPQPGEGERAGHACGPEEGLPGKSQADF